MNTAISKFSIIILTVVMTIGLNGCVVEQRKVEEIPEVDAFETLPTEKIADTDASIDREALFPNQKDNDAPARTIVPGGDEPRALMYHLIREDTYGPYGALFVRPSDFEQQLQIMNEQGCTYLFADEYQKISGPGVIITLDDGYDDNYTNLFPLLKQYNARATVFLVTSLIGTDGYMTWNQIREMSASGYVRFGSHTVNHCDLAARSEEEVRYEMATSKKIIEKELGTTVNSFAYPTGSYNDVCLNVVGDYFAYAYTTNSPNSYPTPDSRRISRYYIARELSMNTFRHYLG